MDILLLVILAIAPPAAFLLYILHLDKLEPEPLGLIIKMMILGGVAVIPAGIAEWFLVQLPLLDRGGVIGAALKSFIVIAPIEEAVKLAVVFLFVWKNPHFNEENDGIVYVGTAAIGFAMLENVFYVIQTGFATGMMRALTAIPLHTFTGVLMGYFIGIARFAPSPKGGNKNIWIGFLIAYLIHAVYDTFVLSGTDAAFMIIPLVVALFVFGILHLKKGKEFSIRRWGATPEATAGAAATAPPPATGKNDAMHPSGADKIRIVISRTLLVLCAIFWAMLIVGMKETSKQGSDDIIEIIAGGIILSSIPCIIGIFLEASCRRRKKHHH
ncbi:MAG: hypothetical protein A2176_12490 [Spirochaetes bacterium RBG_13_51_14]|nr:MAG: hypothetical protein A2176_12490 [Spirochaetes bacterium RBG_13_51_14]